MKTIVKTSGLTKTFKSKVALNALSLTIDRQRVVGLIGQNGSGKTTLLDLIAGNALASEGTCETLGQDSARLDEAALARIGVVFQENRFLDWMRVDQHLAYFGSFYANWDRSRQASLLKELDLNPQAVVGNLSGGDIQKLGIITAVCHHPRLLLLDEPVSSLDPLAREALLKFILRLLDEDDVTIIVSSHALLDIERLVDWVVCLNDGHLAANSALDALQERFAEWRITSRNGMLPERFREGFIREQKIAGRQASMVVENADGQVEAFREKYHADIQVNRLNLERIYPLLLKSSS